jgi:hypothetical protein
VPQDATKQTAAAAAMVHLLEGAAIARIVHTAAELGLADQLGDAEHDAASLAGMIGCHAPSLARLLRALAAVGVVYETTDRCYALTPLGATLRSDRPGSMRAWARFALSEYADLPWRALDHAIRTGENVFQHQFGTDIWSFRSAHPDYSSLFDEAMQSFTLVVNQTVALHYPFNGIGWVIDVGGGNGTLLLSVLERHPNMRGTVYELPHVATRAREHIAAAGFASRCEVIAGDALVEVPKGADAYMLKSVIHGREDDAALTILRNCRDVMPNHAKLLLIERLLPEQIDPDDLRNRSYFIADLNMMLSPGGRERTEAEYRRLLSDAGLRCSRVVRTPSLSAIIEADAA